VRAFLIHATSTESDILVSALWEAGTTGIEERSDGLVAYFDDDGIGLDDLRAVLADATVEPTAIPDVDWVARFRENFRAFAVGGFWITPEWDASAAPPSGRRRLIVDPGRAFGTGTHESTALCLQALEALAAEKDLGRVLDVGTGSGILAIAARILGARAVFGADNDPEAIASAREHARLNGAAVQLVRADGGRSFSPGRFDTVVANITARLLIERAAELSALPAPGGRLVLAGLLAVEADDVRAAYSGLSNVQVTKDGEWTSLTLERS
jgi:ribosomal protein L11 methyltransferase